jgi:polyisoprenoid-binding protein YceI
MRPRALLVAVAIGCAPVSASPRAYAVDPAASVVTIHVGKSGVFGFAGHEHEVVAGSIEGLVEGDPDDLARSSVTLSFAGAGLKVSAAGEPAGDAPKVQEIMAGPQVLDLARFPTIEFRSRQVSGRRNSDGTYELQIAGELGLHGATRPISVPVRVQVSGSTITVTGRASVAQRAFGIEPVTAGGGTVKVKNEVGIDFKIVARAK